MFCLTCGTRAETYLGLRQSSVRDVKTYKAVLGFVQIGIITRLMVANTGGCIQNIFRSLSQDMKEVEVMTYLVRTLNDVLKEKKQIDERAKQVGLEVLSEWVDEQIALCTDEDGEMTRASVEKAEAMNAELQVSLSTAFNIGYEALANKATVILGSKRSDSVTISDLVRFEGYAMLYPRTIRLCFKH